MVSAKSYFEVLRNALGCDTLHCRDNPIANG